MQQTPVLDQQALVKIAQRRRIAYLALFGSYARGEARPGSDVDLYARFGRPVGLMEVLSVQHEMEDALGLPVDLIVEEAVIPHNFMRAGMQRDLVVVYAAGQIVGLRNIVSHEYFQVRQELLWEVASKEVPALAPAIDDILNQLGE